MPPLITPLGIVVATGVYFNDLASAGGAPDDSPFFICLKSMPKMWIHEVSVVYDVNGGSGCEVVVQRTSKGTDTAYVLGTISLTGTHQVAYYLDLSSHSVDDRRLELEEKLTCKFNGTVNPLRGLCVQAILVPFETVNLGVPQA